MHDDVARDYVRRTPQEGYLTLDYDGGHAELFLRCVDCVP